MENRKPSGFKKGCPFETAFPVFCCQNMNEFGMNLIAFTEVIVTAIL